MQRLTFLHIDDFENLTIPSEIFFSLEELLPATTGEVYSYYNYSDNHFENLLYARHTLTKARHLTKIIYTLATKLTTQDEQKTIKEAWDYLNRAGERVLRDTHKEETILWIETAAKLLKETNASTIMEPPSFKQDITLDQWNNFFIKYKARENGERIGVAFSANYDAAFAEIADSFNNKTLLALRYIARNLVIYTGVSPYVNGWYKLNNNGDDVLRDGYISERQSWLSYINITLNTTNFSRR